MNAIEDRARSIFLSAVEREPAQWPAFLDEACGGDAQLRARVDQLLQAHQALGSIHAGAAGAPASTTDEPRGEGPGTIIGPYKLIEQLGEGGMGTVYMAQQTEPVKRLVALKLIRPGMDSRQVIARFEAERQALALMDHPNIARVFDGGTTKGGPGGVSPGRPYFVMELVRGVTLTKYCDEHRLTPQERLELFISVCQAIQHAHQKGIIHRDIKPSNVLVALYDGKPVPKVIDFGVAKATGQQLTEHTLVTGFGAVVGTLEYMSPEQAEVNQLDIDTRSDIYSLGVLLYELLTGTTPLDRKRLREAAMLEMLRLIREQEPPRPSTRLAESKDSLPSISAQRHMEPAKLTKLVRGELDWIVMKALEKDRNRRYETANGFARDIQCYLTDEPVQACPPSAWYRFRKFARRNRTALGVAAAALFFFVLVGGGAGWVVRDRAARQAREADDLELAVNRAEMFERDGKRPEARAALEQAELLAGRAAADPAREARLAALKERLAADARDQQFITDFEDIRLRVQSRIDVEGGSLYVAGSFGDFRDALGRYGIEIGTQAPAEVAARIQGRPEPVRREVVAALVECFLYGPPGGSQTQQWLLDTLAAADDNAWRVRVRQAYLDRNGEVLAQLAREADTGK
jgi:serine/threonine protein kinase